MLMANVCTDANPTNREEKTRGRGGFTFLCETFFFNVSQQLLPRPLSLRLRSTNQNWVLLRVYVSTKIFTAQISIS